MTDWVIWFFQSLAMAIYNIGYALTHLGQWLDWSDKQSMMRFIYYGGSQELFFAALLVFLIVTAIGFWRNSFMWKMVRGLEGIANKIGRFFAWAGIFMVVQQIMIVFLQRVFRVAEITISPFGMDFTKDLSWYGEELKLYNAIIVTLCVTYTFVQGGHVRVDLVYSNVKYRTKKVIDMFGSLFFMLPMATLIWMYSWYFMWRHLITPKVSASDTLELLLRKSKVLKWNVETIGFSPSGFNAYFLFKVLLVTFTLLIFLQAVAFFYRSYLEWKEGPSSEGKYIDRDARDEPEEEAYEAMHVGVE
ncbi:MAG: C4-dicarboxylate ABC transporter permease [Marinosulfonomonas sp.]|nr:MAG: C4-dicarboxylate ABC transporter permease [Marinosulfonomonas sp.]